MESLLLFNISLGVLSFIILESDLNTTTGSSFLRKLVQYFIALLGTRSILFNTSTILMSGLISLICFSTNLDLVPSGSLASKISNTISELFIISLICLIYIFLSSISSSSICSSIGFFSLLLFFFLT